MVRALWVPIDTCLKQAYEEASHGAHIFLVPRISWAGYCSLILFPLGRYTRELGRVKGLSVEDYGSAKIDQEFSHQGGRKAGGLHPGRNPVMQSVLIVDITYGRRRAIGTDHGILKFMTLSSPRTFLWAKTSLNPTHQGFYGRFPDLPALWA